MKDICCHLGVVRGREHGFTLIETMVVVAIIGLMLGASIMTVNNVARSDLRSAASRTAATLRSAFDRATMTGNTIRVAFDLDKGELWLEMSEGRVALRKGDEQHHTTDEQEAGPQGDEEEDKPSGGASLLFGIGGGAGEGEGDSDEGVLGIDADELKRKWERDLAPVRRPKSLFKPLDPKKKKKIAFATRVSIETVVTPRMVDPVEKGMGYVYFFPQGHAEPAVIHLMDKSEEFYSVVLHPLTGRAKVYPCLYEIPEDFGGSDDERRGKRRGTCGGEGW